MFTENQDLLLKIILLTFSGLVALRLAADVFGYLTRAWAGIVGHIRSDKPLLTAFGLLFAGAILAVVRFGDGTNPGVSQAPPVQDAKPLVAHKKGGKS